MSQAQHFDSPWRLDCCSRVTDSEQSCLTRSHSQCFDASDVTTPIVVPPVHPTVATVHSPNSGILLVYALPRAWPLMAGGFPVFRHTGSTEISEKSISTPHIVCPLHIAAATAQPSSERGSRHATVNPTPGRPSIGPLIAGGFAVCRHITTDKASNNISTSQPIMLFTSSPGIMANAEADVHSHRCEVMLAAHQSCKPPLIAGGFTVSRPTKRARVPIVLDSIDSPATPTDKRRYSDAL